MTRTPVRALLVLTSMARASEGGYAFAEGLSHALEQSPDIELTLVLPNGLASATQARLGTPNRAISARGLTGMTRILRDVVMLQRWARQANADIVIVPHEWGSWVGGRTALVAVIQNILFLHPEGKRLHRVKSTLMLRIAQLTSRWIDHSISVSPLAAQLWHDTTGRDSVVLAEGINASFATRNEERVNRSLCIMTGALAHKNPVLARELAQALLREDPDVTITIVGLPYSEQPLAHGRLRILPYMDPADLSVLFAQHEVVAVTSQIESFGLPAFEARAAGCRVVFGRETPMHYWLREDEGVHVADSYTLEAWTNACHEALAGPPVCANNSFTWDALGPDWANHILELASAGGR